MFSFLHHIETHTAAVTDEHAQSETSQNKQDTYLTYDSDQWFQ